MLFMYPPVVCAVTHQTAKHAKYPGPLGPLGPLHQIPVLFVLLTVHSCAFSSTRAACLDHLLGPNARLLRPNLDLHKMTTSTLDHYEQLALESQARQKRDRVTNDLTAPPSAHISAWREYERAARHELGLNPAADRMAYNLYTDCTNLIRTARAQLNAANSGQMQMMGGLRKTAARKAIAALAKAVGYRYMRGLEVIEHGLKPPQLAKFQRDRSAFLEEFRLTADAAHVLNKDGKNPAAVEQVVRLLCIELGALVPWLEKVNDVASADWLARELDDVTLNGGLG